MFADGWKLSFGYGPGLVLMFMVGVIAGMFLAMTMWSIDIQDRSERCQTLRAGSEWAVLCR